VCVFIIVFAAAAAAISARAFLPFFLDKKQNTPISCFLVPALFQPFEKKKGKKILTVRTKPCTTEARKTKLR
jgi:hypothetical protein